MKNEQNARILHFYLREIYLSPNFGGQFPALRLRVSGLDLNTNYAIMVDVILRAHRAKLMFMCLPTLYFTVLA